MRRSTRALRLAVFLAAVAGACGRADGLTAPDAWQASETGAPPLPGGGQTIQDEAPPPPPPPADSTGRWGGGMGSGT